MKLEELGEYLFGKDLTQIKNKKGELILNLVNIAFKPKNIYC